MNFTGSYYLDADQQTVWDLLMDTQSIAAALPGVEELIPIEGETNAWQATGTVKTILISGTYHGTIRMTDCMPCDSYRLTVSGEGQGSAFNGMALISLVYDDGLEQTIIRWDAEGDVFGSLARFGQPVFTVAANMLTKHFFRNLVKQHPSTQRKEEIGEHHRIDREDR